MRALRVRGGSWRLVQAGRFSWRRHPGRVWGMISWLDEVGERLTSRQVWGRWGDRGATDRGHCQEHNQAHRLLRSRPPASESDTKQKKSQLAEHRACTCSAGSSDSHLFLGKKTSAAATQGPWGVCAQPLTVSSPGKFCERMWNQKGRQRRVGRTTQADSGLTLPLASGAGGSRVESLQECETPGLIRNRHGDHN